MNPNYSRIGISETQAMERVMLYLLSAVDPAAAIADVITSASAPGAGAFERYAGAALRDAGGLRLRSAYHSSMLKLLAPEGGRLAQIVHSGSFPQSMQPTLLAVECALNRLICIADAISDGRPEEERAREEPRRSISLLGGGYIASSAGWRSTRVQLPSPKPGVDERYYNEVDWRSTDCVAANARAVFQRSLRPNKYRTTLGVQVKSGSDWDVRTRLAQILDALELPHRYSFRFDYDSAARAVSVVFTCPPPSFLPAIMDTGAERGSGLGPGPLPGPGPGPVPSRGRAYEAYLLRLACLMAAAGFGSGRDVECVKAAGYDASWSDVLVAVQFDRDSFVRSVLLAVDSDEFSQPALRFDPAGVAAMMGAAHLDWLGRPGMQGNRKVALPALAPSTRSAQPWEDERALPADARTLFKCKRVCDLDTDHYLGGHAEAVDMARRDADEAPIAAVLRLEALVEELEGQTRPSDDDGDARPLFAPHPLARLAVCLAGDDMAIADEAQAFIRGADADGAGAGAMTGSMAPNATSSANAKLGPSTPDTGSPGKRGAGASSQAPRSSDATFFRAPSALYYARMGLSDLYQRMGDLRGAAMQADRCIALAPTAAGAYYRKADVLAEQGYYAQAANVLMDGLAHMADSADSSLLYYHLGMLLWNLGKREEAAVVHVYNMALLGEHAARSRQVVHTLRKQAGTPEGAFGTSFSASQRLQALGMPLAPANLRTQVVQAAIALANAGAPLAAAPYAAELARHCTSDSVITAACRSIQLGTAV